MCIGRIFSLAVALITSLALSAENGATSFMGIAVDGSVKVVKHDLTLTGFSPSKEGEVVALKLLKESQSMMVCHIRLMSVLIRIRSIG